MANGVIETMDENIYGNGNPSYKGYEYQKVATAWVALTLFFNETPDIANGIIVEPASNEDIEAELKVPPEEATATIVVPQAEQLMIQIKFRGSGYWSSKAFVSLVEDKAKKGAQGPAPRLRAKNLLLADPARRYVLLTNISVDNSLSEGRIERIDKKPPKSFIPEGVAKGASEKADLVGRFGVIECLTPQVIAGEIRHVLESAGHVPTPNVEKAVDAIKRAIEDRLLGLSSPLTRNEVLAIIESCGGLPHSDRELSEYVPPTSAQSARNTLARENVVLLVGPPGYGKSLTAKQLVMEHRLENPPFEVIRQTAGLEGIDESLRAPGRHVFYLDDPWGQSKLQFDANRWNIELPNLLRRASPDKKFVITSRTDILRLAFVKTDESPWKSITCTISKESYDNSSRWDILTRKLENGGQWRNDFVCQYRSKLLRDLASPLALDRFAKALLAVASTDKADANELVKQAQIESITRIVAEQVKGWPCHGVACGTILWVLLRLGGKASPERLKALRRALEKISPPLELDLEGFVNHLKPVSINENDDRTLSAHGKVIEALEQLVKHYHVEAERSINRVLVAYQLLFKSDETYIDELLSVLDAVKSVRSYGIEIDSAIIQNIDALLLDRLTKAEGRVFSRAFGQVSRFASNMHPLARLVRYLGQGVPKQKQEGFDALSWVPPQVTASETTSICAEPVAKVVIAKFIASVLPYESEKYDSDDLFQWLQPFGFDLSSAFLAASQHVTSHSGFLMNGDTVIKCAILSSATPQYDDIFCQIEKLESLVEEDQKKRGLDVSPWQGELNFYQQLHLQDELEEEGSAVSHAVDGYVRGRRFREGYDWIPPHRRADLIMPAWADAMTFAKPKVTINEIESFLATANSPSMRARGLRVIGEKKIQDGTPHLLSALEIGSLEERKAAVRALTWINGKGDVEDLIAAAMGKNDILGQIDLLLASRELETYKKDAIAVMQRLQQRCPPQSQEFLILLILANSDRPGSEILDAFRRVDPGTVVRVMEKAALPIARFLLSVSAYEGRDVTELAERWLASDEVDDVMAAVDAFRRVTTAEARTRIAAVIEHRDYKVRRSVIEALASDATEVELDLILRLATDRSAPVRERLASLIGEHRWSSGLPVLLTLLHDKRDYTRHPEFDARNESRFNVARTAAAALESFEPLSAGILDNVLSFVAAGNSASKDIELHALLVSVLASAPDDRIVGILCSLLSDDRVVGGKNENLYPVRYAAAWSLLHHLNAYPQHQQAVDWAAVQRGAIHSDPQLAAPCLLLLGTGLTEPTPGALSVLRSVETSETRRVLALLGMDNLSTAQASVQKYALLPSDHPFLTMINGWQLTKPFEDWVRKLDKGSDVEGVILKIAASEAGVDLGVNDFDATRIRRKESIPITSPAEMFGME